MPQGKVVNVTPPVIPEYEWLIPFVEFIKTNNGADMKIGVIETTDPEGNSSITKGEKLLFVVPSNQYPPTDEDSDSSNKEQMKVNFKVRKGVFKYIDEVKQIKVLTPQ